MARPRRFLRAGVGAGLVAALLLPAAAAAGGGGGYGGGRDDGNVPHIFVIMLENHSLSTVIGDPNAPYITSLATRYAQATNYYGVTHPSEPNYVAAITGQMDTSVMDDNPNNTFAWPNLVDQLEAHRLTWGAYMEAMPSVGYTGAQWPSNTALYANKHNPFVLMTDILSSPARLSHIKPYTSLAADLDSRHAPNFVWITPDQCNDMHGGVYVAVPGYAETPCPYGNTVDDANDASLKAKADAFVKSAVTTIKSSRAWTGNSAIFLMTDEADYSGNAANDGWADVSGCCDSPGYGGVPALPTGYQFLNSAGLPDGNTWAGGPFGGGKVPSIVVAREGDRGVVDATPYNHYSLLRTIEQVWHLGYLGYAADARNVRSMVRMLEP